MSPGGEGILDEGKSGKTKKEGEELGLELRCWLVGDADGNGDPCFSLGLGVLDPLPEGPLGDFLL